MGMSRSFRFPVFVAAYLSTSLVVTRLVANQEALSGLFWFLGPIVAPAIWAWFYFPFIASWLHLDFLVAWEGFFGGTAGDFIVLPSLLGSIEIIFVYTVMAYLLSLVVISSYRHFIRQDHKKTQPDDSATQASG